MKFYYDDQLVRTSKCHNYKYAIIGHKNGKITKAITCSETLEGITAWKEAKIRDLIGCGMSEEEFKNKVRYIQELPIVELEARA